MARKRVNKKDVENIADYSHVEKALRGKVPTEAEHQNINGSQSTSIHRTLQIRTFPISIGFPLDELMFSQFFQNVVNLSIMPWDNIISTTSTLIEEARNKIHDHFLNNTTHPYLLMLDSDVLPPPDLIERLLSHDKSVVGGYYHRKEQFPVKDIETGETKMIQRPVVYDYSNYVNGHHKYNQRMQAGEGLEQVDGMGAGCWLIKREVIEAIGESPYNFHESGEDLTFCRAVYNAGFSVWVDWDTMCAHCGVFHV